MVFSEVLFLRCIEVPCQQAKDLLSCFSSCSSASPANLVDVIATLADGKRHAEFKTSRVMNVNERTPLPACLAAYFLAEELNGSSACCLSSERFQLSA